MGTLLQSRAAYLTWAVIACPAIAWAAFGIWGGSDSLSGPIAIFLVLPAAFAGGAGFISRRSPNEIVLAAITSAAIALISFLVVLLIVFLTLPEGVFQ